MTCRLKPALNARPVVCTCPGWGRSVIGPWGTRSGPLSLLPTLRCCWMPEAPELRSPRIREGRPQPGLSQSLSGDPERGLCSRMELGPLLHLLSISPGTGKLCDPSPFTQIIFLMACPLPLWSSFSELSEMLPPRL